MAAVTVTVGILTAWSRRGDPLSQPSSIQGSCRRADGESISLSPGVDSARSGRDRGRRDTAARCGFALQLVRLSPRRGRLRVPAGVKRDERSGGCDCLHSVPLRSPGTQRPAERARQIRSRGERRDLQVGGRSEALIIKMDSAQESRDGRVSAARAH